MGRLADARKRARQDEASRESEPAAEPARAAEAAPPEAEAPGKSPTAAAPAGGRGEAAGATTTEPASEDTVAAEPSQAGAEGAPPADVHGALVFPADEPRPPARYVLPASGLADEILAAAASEGVTEAETAPAQDDAALAARAHQFTFFAAPEREAREQVEATEHLVTFIVGDEEYGVDVHLVHEIIRVPLVTTVPRAPAFVRGVINLRGRIIPVIDLKTKLGLGRVDAGQRRARVVVVRLKERLVGLLVDGASQVLKVPVSMIEAAPEEVVEVEARFLRGVAKLDGRLIILVDLLEVLAPELRAAGAAP